MDQQPPMTGQPSGPDDMTIPMPAASTPQPSTGQYGPYYPPPMPAQPQYRAPQFMAPQPARMPKHEALAVTRKLKTGLIAGSVMSFGVLVALVASHVTGATARQASNSSASNTNSSGVNPPSYSNSDDGGYFDDGPNSSNNGGFGTSPSAPSQYPVGGSGVS